MRGHPTSRDQLLPQLLLLALERCLELQKAFLAEGTVGRPGRLIKRSPGGVDGLVHVSLRRITHGADHLLGSRVDDVEGAGAAVDELAVDEKTTFVLRRGVIGHVCLLLGGGGCRRADVRG